MEKGGDSEEKRREKAIDEWLPITSDRNAKWWYSTMHNVTAMVGAAVLSLPYAMSEMGWGAGVTVMLLSWIITFYTIWQMVEMHEMIPGKKKFQEILFPNAKPIKLTYFIMIFSSFQFVLSHLPNFNSISSVHDLLCYSMDCSYATLTWLTSGSEGDHTSVDYSAKSEKTSDNVFMFLSALGNVAFAYAGHNVVLEIQATIPSTEDAPSKKAMWKGVFTAYIIVALCYLPVAFIGYWVFGNGVDDNILLTLHRPTWLIATANIFVVAHVIGSFQVYAMPVFDMIEAYAVKSLKYNPSTLLRVCVRTVFVAFTLVVGFFGGFALAPTSYYLPCIIWLIIKKPRQFGLSWCTNWLCIIVGVLLTLTSPIGGLWSIIKSAKTYRFYT
ncbi:lysine histidine transporter-like 2 [Nicotiana tomentosiformis]|uniref:lysine histidine transporter-like 2 n=1 Tax=Nicotiana tomentosiformis TaxID=4098 RepID=UPI00388C7EE0